MTLSQVLINAVIVQVDFEVYGYPIYQDLDPFAIGIESDLFQCRTITQPIYALGCNTPDKGFALRSLCRS